MSGDNGYRVKAEIHPVDYKHGPPYIFTKEDVERWEASAAEVLAKIERQRGMTPEEIRALDDEAFGRSEETYRDLMKGPEEE